MSSQEKEWSSGFGIEYTYRNLMTLEECDKLYQERYGVTRSQMDEEFLDLDKEVKILEVGCNVGLQLLYLKRMGFRNLTGIDISSYAVEMSKIIPSGANIKVGSALEIPFKDNRFDLVFTSGLLIHISPDDLGKVMGEIYRCTKEYIWGFEYYEETLQGVKYRGKSDLLWKGNYPMMFCLEYDDLDIVKTKIYRYTESNNMDVMYLLRKNG